MNGSGKAAQLDPLPRTSALCPEGATLLRPFGTYIDWLTINTAAPISLWDVSTSRPWRVSGQRHDDRKLWLQPCERGTEVFKRKFYLVDHAGTKLVTFCAIPHAAELHPPDMCTVQFMNCTLYSDLWRELWGMLQRAGFAYRGVTRLDIAADGLGGEGGDYQEVLQRSLFGGAGRYYGKAKWTPEFFRGRVEGFMLGTRASDKYLRCYCKSRELKAQGRAKPHIEDAWAATLGFDPMADDRTVNRFELRVKGKELRDHFIRDMRGPLLDMVRTKDGALMDVRGWHVRERCGGILDHIMDPMHRGLLVRSLTSTLFDFRTFAVRARDAKPLAVWDWSRCSRVTDVAFERKAKTITMSANAVKTMLRNLYLYHLATGDPDTLRECIKIAHAGGNHLVGWWNASKEKWSKHNAHLRQRKADGSDTGLFAQFSI